MARATVILGIALGARAATAQSSETEAAPQVSEGAAAHPPRAWEFAVLPIPYYQPETSLGMVGQVVLVRTASSGSATEERHDSLSASATATLRRQYAFGLSAMKFWNQDHDRLKVDVGIQSFPNTFWGVGNHTPMSAADHYTPLSVGAQPNYSHRVVERIFVGMNAVGGYLGVQSFAPGGPVADYLATHRRQGSLIGVGPTVARDSRDDSNYPRAGSLTALTLTAYPTRIPSFSETLSLSRPTTTSPLPTGSWNSRPRSRRRVAGRRWASWPFRSRGQPASTDSPRIFSTPARTFRSGPR